MSAGLPITFEDFQPGEALGEASLDVDAAMLASLEAIYGVAAQPGRPVPLPLCTADAATAVNASTAAATAAAFSLATSTITAATNAAAAAVTAIAPPPLLPHRHRLH